MVVKAISKGWAPWMHRETGYIILRQNQVWLPAAFMVAIVCGPNRRWPLALTTTFN
jgi:hypothetical protein